MGRIESAGGVQNLVEASRNILQESCRRVLETEEADVPFLQNPCSSDWLFPVSSLEK